MTALIKARYERHPASEDCPWEHFIQMVEADGYMTAKRLYAKLCNEVVDSWDIHV